MAMLQSGAKDNATTGKAADLFANLPVSSMDTGLLGFAPLYHVLQAIAQDDDLAGSSSYQQVIQSLQNWVHDSGADSKQLDKRLVDQIDLTCHTLRKKCIERRQSMVSNDTGYASSGETAEV